MAGAGRIERQGEVGAAPAIGEVGAAPAIGEVGAAPAIGELVQYTAHGRRAQGDPDDLGQVCRQRRRRPVAEAIAPHLGGRLLHRVAEFLAGDRIHLARPPRPRAVPQPRLALVRVALHLMG